MIVKFHKSFEKQFAKLPKKVREQFKARRDIFLINPYSSILSNHPLTGDFLGYRSINVTGDFRAIYKQEGDIAIFTDIDTHSNLYGS